MPAARQLLDVWLLDSNTVYRDVPFTVVCDWVQEGRLLEDDCVRRAGGTDWKKIATIPAFAAFLPRPEPTRPDDQAEALDRVEFEFGWKKKRGEGEDEEVDMIPLIDVSLVLLIFFMLTASGVGAAALVNLAGVKNPPITDTKGISINMAVKTDDKGKRSVLYSLGVDGKPTRHPDDRDISKPDVLLRQLNLRLAETAAAEKKETVDITINPDKNLEDGELVKMLRDVKSVPNRQLIGRVYNGVTEK